MINYYAILVCGILSMIIGFVWYGPLFGRKWMEIVKVTPEDMERRREMQKKAGPLYIVQFVITLFQVWVLEYVIQGLSVDALGGVYVALWACVGFVLPIVAGSAMWNNDTKKVAWARFLIQGGYQIILFIAFGVILGAWR